MPNSSNQFDVIVVGGGHAGSEAALASARMGLSTALVSFRRDKIGEMSCNPAIGGLGKGQLVKELDALFGEMGRAIDDAGIQFRTLNSSKGPAVRSSRAQADRVLYQKRVLLACETCPNLTIIEAAAGALERSGRTVTGVRTEAGELLSAKAVVLTTGTFLRGLMHTGEVQTEGGRVGEKASMNLSDSIRALGLRMGRMKTGTPPRLRRSSIDYSLLEEQPGDYPPKPFSFRTPKIDREQVSCWITATNERTHEIISENLARSPMYNGQIKSGGPRYCPSIEDKISRFKDKNSHNIFLEPEGYESDIVYPNGISTSLPRDVQDAYVRSIIGLEHVEILQYGYAVEYDHVDPTELDRSLKVAQLEGLYLAGQINGTTGYEEAGAQGIMAGINAALFARGREPFTIGRDAGYIGVMIDDLTTLGVVEPYRMFTSRAEHRLHLREDNADARLTPRARELGLVDDAAWAEFEARQGRIENERTRFVSTRIKPIESENAWLASVGSAEIKDSVSLAVLLRRPELTYATLAERFPRDTAFEALSDSEIHRLETELKFDGYLKRQDEDIERLRKMEDTFIPTRFQFEQIPGLSVEVCERLRKVQPETLGQASRVSGVTPAAIALIAVHLKRKSNPAAQA